MGEKNLEKKLTGKVNAGRTNEKGEKCCDYCGEAIVGESVKGKCGKHEFCSNKCHKKHHEK